MTTNNQNDSPSIHVGMMKVVCKDKVTIEVPLIAARMSVVFQTFLQTVDEMGGSDVIPHMHLPNIESSTLVKIVAFCLHYQCVEPMRPIPKPVPSSMHDCVQKWYADYVDLQDSSRMMDLTIAAKYLAIQPLLDLTCGKIATSMAGKTHDELRAIFGVFNSSTPNE